MKGKTLLVAFVAMLLAGCGDEPPKSIQDTSRDITKVSDVTDGAIKVLVIDMKPSAGHSDSSFLFMATEDINKVVAKITKYFQNQQADRIDFVLTTGLSDKYGNSKDFPVIRLSFDMPEVKKVNFQNTSFTSWDLLNLAHPANYLHPVGKKIVAAYCGEESNAKFAQEFCRASL